MDYQDFMENRSGVNDAENIPDDKPVKPPYKKFTDQAMLADFIHEHTVDCRDPKSGHGRDCDTCYRLAVQILEWQKKERS